MFKLFQRTKTNKDNTQEQQDKQQDTNAKEKPSFVSRLRKSLSRTKAELSTKIASIFIGKSHLDDEALEELEAVLIQADVGIELTEKLIESIKLAPELKKNPDQVIPHLKAQMLTILKSVDKNLEISTENGPFVILLTGINGAGKTTSCAKLSKFFQDQKLSVMLAAGDTFRAAAVEQLQSWGAKENIPVVSQQHGADSASVIFDAYNSATAKGIDVLLADTAGRLHTQDHLMRELEKISKVLKKINPKAPQEVLIVLDAGTGQNSIRQVSAFNKILGVTGICITKLDGTAKGGTIFQIANEFQIPIRYIGIGEQIDDLKPFVAKDFVDALFDGITSKDSPDDKIE